MSYNQASLEVVNSILKPLAPVNAQFPLLLFSQKDCLGKRYPPEGEFNLWNQDLDLTTVGFDTIRSLYVPPHALLEMWSTGDGDGYYSVQGPNIISSTGSMLAFWSHYDNSPCFSTEVHCGKRVGSADGWKLLVDISRMRITWNLSWVELLHNFASNGQTLAFGGTEYAVNNDTLFNEICPHPYDRYSCNCHSAYQLIQQNHPGAAGSSYVNLQQNGCNPNIMYVPSGGNIAAGTLQECTVQINAQLSTGTFPTIDNGGSEFYICAGKTYLNGVKDPVPRTMAEEAASTISGFSSTSGVPTTGFPTYAYYVIGAFLLTAVLMTIFYYYFRTRPIGHKTIHRIKLQKDL